MVMPVFRLEVVIMVVVERKRLGATGKWSDNYRDEGSEQIERGPRDPWVSRADISERREVGEDEKESSRDSNVGLSA